MALTKCKECGAEVSTSAKVCPTCGYGIAAARGQRGCAIFFAIFCGIVALSIVGTELGGDKQVPPPTSPPAPAAARAPSPAPVTAPPSLDRQLKVAAPACLSSEIYEKLAKLIYQHDQEASTKLFGAGLITGQCRMLKEGQRIVIEEVHPFGYPCVRIRGDVQCWYTSNEFLQQVH